MFRGAITAQLNTEKQKDNAKIQKQIQQLKEEIALCKQQILEIQRESQRKLVNVAKEAKELNIEAAKYRGPSIYEAQNAGEALKISEKQSSLKKITPVLREVSLLQSTGNLELVTALINKIDEKSKKLQQLESFKPSTLGKDH